MTAMIPNESAPRWWAGMQESDDPYPFESETFDTWAEAYDYYLRMFDWVIAWSNYHHKPELLRLAKIVRMAVSALDEEQAIITIIQDVEYFLTRKKES